jgi:hypothetical protein
MDPHWRFDHKSMHQKEGYQSRLITLPHYSSCSELRMKLLWTIYFHFDQQQVRLARVPVVYIYNIYMIGSNCIDASTEQLSHELSRVSNPV